jgi:hypothetical protein
MFVVANNLWKRWEEHSRIKSALAAARVAMTEQRWNDALSRAAEALGVDPENDEARRIQKAVIDARADREAARGREALQGEDFKTAFEALSLAARTKATDAGILAALKTARGGYARQLLADGSRLGSDAKWREALAVLREAEGVEQLPEIAPKIAEAQDKVAELAYSEAEAALTRRDPAAAWRSFTDAGNCRDARSRANKILVDTHAEVSITEVDGTTVEGVLLAYDGDAEIVIRTDEATVRVDRRRVKTLMLAPPRAPRTPHTGRLPSWGTCVDLLATGTRGATLRQIPATVIETGVMRAVPYISHRTSTLELNVYGDPQNPAAIEVGIFDAGQIAGSGPGATHETNAPDAVRPVRDVEAEKREVVALVRTLLADALDQKVVDGLRLDADRQERAGLTFEVTPSTAEDAYGGWWVSIYDLAALDRARASRDELHEITERRMPAPGRVGGWTASDLARARPVKHEGDVYVRGYTRRDGTYVRPHTRSRPHG